MFRVQTVLRRNAWSITGNYAAQYAGQTNLLAAQSTFHAVSRSLIVPRPQRGLSAGTEKGLQ